MNGSTHGSDAGLAGGEVSDLTAELLDPDVELLNDDVQRLDVLVVVGSLHGRLFQAVGQLVHLRLVLALLLVDPGGRK